MGKDQVPWEQLQHRLENPREPSVGVLGVALELCAQISVILYFTCSSYWHAELVPAGLLWQLWLEA